jgi:hypothetical protein
MPLTNRVLLAVSILATLAATGCTTNPLIEVHNRGVVLQRTDSAVSGSIGIDITNPGTLEIELLEYHYLVTTSNGLSWSGRHAGELVLSPGLDRSAALPIVVRAPTGRWPAGQAPDSLSCNVSGSLIYIGNGIFDESLAELGYRPSVSFSGAFQLATAQAAQAN